MQYLILRNILDMAETPIIPNADLPVTSNLNSNTPSLNTVGQNQDINGKFSAHLDKSLDTLSNVDSGEGLPIEGKSLPHAADDLKSKLSSFTQELKLNSINSSLSFNELALTLEEGVETKLADIPQLSSLLSEVRVNKVDGIAPTFSALTDNSSILDSIEDTVSTELATTNHAISQIIEESSVVSLSPTYTKIAASHPVQIDYLAPSTPIVENQKIATIATPYVPPAEIEIQRNLLNNADIEVETEGPVNNTAASKFDKSENSSEKLADFISKYLSEDNSSKIFLKNQINDADQFQQNITSLKSDSTLQNVGINTTIDTYANLNTSVLQNKAIEAPIPLLIKQGVHSEQIQKEVDQSITQNVRWLIGNKAQNAKINVFPESMGQINIALNLEDSNLKLNFIASSHVTKDLIEASISTLRNLFHETGINLQEVNVEAQLSDQAKEDSHFEKLNAESSLNSADISAMDVSEADKLLLLENAFVQSAPLYLLDAYA